MEIDDARSDHFPLELQECERRFFAVLIERVTVETADENRDKIFERGIYSFSNRDKRNLFTKRCNGDRQRNVAFRFNREKGLNK